MKKKHKTPENHTIGTTRYLTIRAIFPGDNEEWIDQVMFAQPLDLFLKDLSLEHNIKFDLLSKGETRHQDQNGMIFLYQIEQTKRNRVWGLNKDK